LKVVELRGFHVGFSPTPAIGNARTFIRRRDFLLLQVVTESGETGWGEVFSSPHAAGALIQARLAPLVLNESALDYGRIWDRLMQTLGYDRRGVAMMAISAIDMALHDVTAKAQGRSVAAMLGGALRNRVFAYASGPFIAEGSAPYGHYAADVDKYLRQGFRAIKPRAGIDPRADGRMACGLRAQIGADFGLMVDINQGYNARAAIASARHMEDADLLWIEEPVLPEDIGGYQTIAAAVPVAIAGGEALGSLAAFRDFLSAKTFSVLQPDLTVCGGYTGFAKIAALAEAYEIPVMPHVFGTIVNQRAALQMAALLPAKRGGGPAPYPYVEIDATDNPLLYIAGAMGVESDGMMAIPDAPGTGLDLDPARLEPWITQTWRIGA
jgi:L-alanine-DL-glutamate epimerase-like enolase superfamily enzyme